MQLGDMVQRVPNIRSIAAGGLTERPASAIYIHVKIFKCMIQKYFCDPRT